LPAIGLLRPLGGETFAGAGAETLLFTIDEASWGGVAPVRLQVLDGLTVLLDDSVAADTSGAYAYSWAVPDHETSFALLIVSALDRFGWAAAETSGAFTIVGSLTGVAGQVPARDALLPGYPNPFNGGTELGFSLRAPARVSLAIFDLRGRQVATLADGEWPAGTHRVRWLGIDGGGRPASSGTYVARLAIRGEGRNLSQTTRLTLVK
jgi:hypothetical protein